MLMIDTFRVFRSPWLKRRIGVYLLLRPSSIYRTSTSLSLKIYLQGSFSYNYLRSKDKSSSPHCTLDNPSPHYLTAWGFVWKGKPNMPAGGARQLIYDQAHSAKDP